MENLKFAIQAAGTGNETMRDETMNNLFRVYPNPTTGVFTLELSEVAGPSPVKVEIYGMLGEKLLDESMNGEKMHEFTLEGKPSGVYYIRVETGSTSGSAKIIRQ